jgi:hypothetical protein
VNIEIEKQKTKITNDNPTTVYYHTPHLWKRIQWHIQRDSERSVLATEWRQTHSLNGTDTTHLLVCAQHSPTIFLLKKIKKSTWKHQKPPWPCNHPKIKNGLKVQEYSWMQTLFFRWSNSYFSLYMNNRKKNTLAQHIFDPGIKKYF